MPGISVCIATYNGEKHIARQLGSILEQLADTDEVIVSDDGSGDRTLDLISGFQDPRVKIIKGNTPKGVVGNFETALEKARGDYIFLSDQDDVWEPRKREKMLACLSTHDLVVSDCTIIDDDGTCIFPSYFDLRRSGKGVVKNVIANSYMGACMGFNRKILDAALPFPDRIPMHDWWIGMVGELVGTPCFCSEKLVRYRRHQGNHSPFIAEKQFGLMEKMKIRKDLVLPLADKWIQIKFRDRQSRRKAAI